MKKIILTSLLAFAALGAGAQTADDALLFSENEYSGTARTIAMGNAFSALGGDIGSITLNPAGSAVNKYSQFSFTPLLKLNYSYSDINADNGYQHSFYNDASIVRAYPLNNIGAIAYFDTHNSTGLKSISFGFVANMTKSYADKYIGRGINSNTSYMGQLAAGLNGTEMPDFPGVQDRKDMLIRELEGRLKYLPEDVAVREFRSVMPYYVKGLPGSAQIKVKLVNAVSFDEVKEIIELA